ncbi:MAG: hypothetical protein H7X93_14465 [Sphingomonadaceae bacterium]|nr:hypothetical protein [Sphingomonadaceae bacterium]
MLSTAAANRDLSDFALNWMYWGAFGFGLVIGWFVYYVNRYRKGDVQLGDITTLIGAVGGAVVVQLFGLGTGIFGAYGVGLAVGFFGYFLVLVGLVSKSPNFSADWFLDGRRKNPGPNEGYGTQERPPMAPQGGQDGFYGSNPGAPMALRMPEPARAPATTSDESNARKVIETCKAQWPATKGSCNGFVTAVASELGVTLSGTANQILDHITGQGSEWKALSDGVAAKAAAEKGSLVIAGLRSGDFTPADDHGHVVIVVAGPMNPGGWAPAAYWGSINSAIAAKGGDGSPLSLCFRKVDGQSAKFVYRSFDW